MRDVLMPEAVADAYLALVDAMSGLVRSAHEHAPFPESREIRDQAESAGDAFFDILEASLALPAMGSPDLTPALTESVAQALTSELVKLRSRVDHMEDFVRDATRGPFPRLAESYEPLAAVEERRREQEADIAAHRRQKAQRERDVPGYRRWSESQP